jgi:hypothetical protein
MGSYMALATRDLDPEADDVHKWRVKQLVSLGLSRPVADAVADQVDWHEVAKLVHRGCPASLAIAIIE